MQVWRVKLTTEGKAEAQRGAPASDGGGASVWAWPIWL